MGTAEIFGHGRRVPCKVKAMQDRCDAVCVLVAEHVDNKDKAVKPTTI